MSFKLVLTVLINLVFLSQLVQGKNHTSCKRALGTFADRNVKFIGCAVESSEPVNLCQQCVKKYRESEQAYANISLFLDDNNVSCAAHYLNLDKLNILETVHLNSVNLWVAANCDACFAGNNTISEFGQKFLNLSDLMNDCLVTAKDKCQDCEKSYLMLNELYEREKKFNKLCFDLEDIMNKTRRTWSGTYKCCMDKKDSLTAFIITASILSSIPVFFYVGLYVYGMMQNSYYEHLDGADVSGRGSINTMSARTTSNPGPSSIAASGSVAQPSSQANNSSSSSRPKNNFEDRPLPALPRSKPISNRPNMLADLDSDDETPAT